MTLAARGTKQVATKQVATKQVATKQVTTKHIYVQRPFRDGTVPLVRELRAWASLALAAHDGPAQVTVRVVAGEEMQALNSRYRGKDYATNVLSFLLTPAPLVGDIVICAPVVAAEAQAQGKSTAAHWAHMTVHGVLHLLGHDHQGKADATAMEAREVQLLGQLGIADPYRESHLRNGVRAQVARAGRAGKR